MPVNFFLCFCFNSRAPAPADAPKDPAAGLYSSSIQTPRSDEAPYDSQSYHSQPISSPHAESTHLISSDDEMPSKVRRRKRVNVYGDEIED